MSEKYPFAFSAILYYDKEYNRQSGFGFAESFGDAAAQLENYYGPELVSIMRLELFEENSLIMVPEKVIEDYKNADDNYGIIKCDENGKEIAE